MSEVACRKYGISKARVASVRTAISDNTGRYARSGKESRAHYAHDSSGQLRRIFDLVNRAIGRGFIRPQQDDGAWASKGECRVSSRGDSSMEAGTAVTV